ncbi:type IV secretion system DNA-binding domain-containing protein [Candidatus Kaiserbacteria bacterium]|nr:type IV secretion system DNA-binding domain-containing protein [Candidatus Kaiserbacteria bacterium]
MTAFDPEKITFFAKTDARGAEVPFGIRAKDRQRHMYVVGKTGMGKSTLLENMAAQDIQNGEGMAFIDPHGSAAETLLEYVPEHRVKDVVYFAPFDLDNPVSFNVMEDVGADKRHLVVSGLMSTFKKIWVDAWSARMEYILTNALLVLIEYPDTTLLSVNRLFIDKKFREQVVNYCKDPAVKSFWTEEFAGYTDRFAAEALPAIQNKIGQFTGNPLIRNIIGQPHSSFDIRQIMDDKKILIMNLSKGLIGETNANLLGSMLTTRIYLAAMSRADLPVEKMKQMPNFYFYVDEFQSFANATFANILSEARKYHLNLIIAHQYIEQMEEEVRDAVFGNVGTTVSFRVGPFDAETLETVFTPRFLAADLVNLGFAQIYLTLMIDGIGSQPFSAVTLPPIQRPPVSCKGMVLESSRKLYAKDRESVEKIVADLHTPEKKEDTRKSFDKNGGNNGFNKNQPAKPWQGKKPEGQQQRPSENNEQRRPNQEQARPGQPRAEFSRLQKPTPNQKSPEDLRNILSKMTKNNESGSNGKSNSVSVSTKDSGSEHKNNSSKPKPEADLKSALASVLSSVAPAATEKKPAVDEVKADSSPTLKRRENNSPRPAAHNNNDNQKRGEGEKRDGESQKPRSADFVRKNNQSPSQSGIRRVVVEQKRFHPVEREGVVTEEKLESSPKEAAPMADVAPLRRQNNLNTAEIKRMLRHNDQERSPFV